MTNARDALKKTIESHVLLHANQHRRITTPGGAPSAWTFDFRAVALDPDWLDRYAETFWDIFAEHFPFQVGGLETAAIPLIAAIVTKGKARGTPVTGFYIRKSRDRDGLMKRVEGTLSDRPIVLVDDLINSGKSFHTQLKVLDNLGKKVAHLFTIVAFRSPEAYPFAHERNIRLHHLFTLEDFSLPMQKSSPIPETHESLETLWKFTAGNPSFEWVMQKSAPVIDAHRIYFGTDKGVLYALEQNTGEIAWQFQIERFPLGKGIFSSPILHGETIYFGAYDGNVYALDTVTGQVKWKYGDADWVGSSPSIALDLGLVYIGLEFGLWKKRGGIIALDMHRGTRKWQDRTPALTHGSPLYIKEENLVVCGSNDGVVYAYDAKSGERRWTHQTGGDIKTRPAYDTEKRLVLVPSMDSKLYALSAQDGLPRWGFRTGAGIYSNPLVNGDRVLISSLDKSLYSIDLASGKQTAGFETSGRIFASPIMADGSLWIGSNDGRLYELDPITLQSRSHHQFAERIVNAITYNATTKRLFVPTVANEVYCLMRKDVAVQ